MEADDFYEEDEPLEDLLEAFRNGDKHRTRPPWFEDSPETQRLFAEEVLLLDATEMVAEALHEAGVSRDTLAERVGVDPGEIRQILSGARVMNLRELAAMLHVLGFHVILGKAAISAGSLRQMGD